MDDDDDDCKNRKLSMKGETGLKERKKSDLSLYTKTHTGDKQTICTTKTETETD